VEPREDSCSEKAGIGREAEKAGIGSDKAGISCRNEKGGYQRVID